MGLKAIVIDDLTLIVNYEFWPLVHTLDAIHSLPLLETLSLAQICGRGHSTRMVSKNLRRVIFFRVRDIDIGTILKGQARLEYVHCAPKAYPIASQVCEAWLKLQELSLCVKMSAEWSRFIEEALDGGGLRNLRTISVDDMDSDSTLWKLTTVVSRYSIPVTSLRFLFTEEYRWDYRSTFGPSTLAHVFASLPNLEVLCVDQENSDDYYSVEGDP